MSLTSSRWLIIKKGSIIIERFADYQSNTRNTQSVLLKSAVNMETLKILDRPIDDHNKRTLDVQEFDLKDELKKVLGLKSTTNKGSVMSTIESKLK
jgi:hypothetical protein